ncbi:MAG: TRAP transporter small permease [Cloacibacillus sp.]
MLLRKIENLMTKAEEYIVALLLFVLTMAIFVSVLERFVFHFGITWIEEFARYLSVWAAFIGSALAVTKGAHIGIEAFVQILPEPIRKIEDLAVNLVGMAFAITVTVIGTKFLFKLSSTGQLSPALGIPISWAYAAVPVGCGLMALHYFFKFVLGISEICKNGKEAVE